MLLLLLGCTPTGESPVKESEAQDSAVDSVVEWTSLAGPCEAPSELPPDPIEAVGQARTTQDVVGYLVEMVDVEPFGDYMLGAGQGGMLTYNVADPAAPFLAGHAQGPGQDRFHRVEVLNSRYVAATNREHGIAIFDLQNPALPYQVWFENNIRWEGMAAVDGMLYVTAGERLEVLDVSTPTQPRRQTEVAGLRAAWELSAPIDGWIYAADNVLGLVPIDIRVPTAPVVGTAVDLGAGVLHVRAAGNLLVASLGGAGVAILDASNPATPVEIARMVTGGSVVMTDVSGTTLYAVDHEALLAWDISDPAKPLALGREETEQFALAVVAKDDLAWVGDWALMESYRVNPEARAGQLDIPGTGLLHGMNRLYNRGGGTLRLLGGAGDGLELEAEAIEIPPDGSVSLVISGSGDEVCLASDDPDSPVRTERVTDATTAPVGQVAPDFSLPDLNGVPYRLSEQLGSPVLLVYFATW